MGGGGLQTACICSRSIAALLSLFTAFVSHSTAYSYLSQTRNSSAFDDAQRRKYRHRTGSAARPSLRVPCRRLEHASVDSHAHAYDYHQVLGSRAAGFIEELPCIDVKTMLMRVPEIISFIQYLQGVARVVFELGLNLL